MTALTHQDIREGSTYTITVNDALGGEYYVKGDRVTVITKVAGQPFQCRNERTGRYFYIAGASSFES